MAKSARLKPLRQKPAFKQLKELLKQTGQRDLVWYHRAGQCVERLFPTEGGRQYGQNKMVELASALGEKDKFADELWRFRSFFNSYDRDDAKRLSERNKSDAFQLTWTHINCLQAVDDAAIRKRYQNQCIKQRWSTDQLRRVINEEQGRKSAGGRRLTRPKTLDAAVRDMNDRSEDWLKRFKQLWFDQDEPVISTELPIQDQESLPELLQISIEHFGEIAGLIERDLPRLKQMKAWFDKQQKTTRKPKRKVAKRKTVKKKKTSRRR